MSLSAAIRSVTRSFFSGGWLLIAALPYFQVLGRGVFNVMGLAFLAWGLTSLAVGRPRLDRWLLAFYASMIAAFTISAALAANPEVAFERLHTFILYSLICWPVVAAVQTDDDLRRMVNAFALSTTFTIATLWLIYAFKAGQSGFTPEQQMREDNLPLLLPFLLCYLHRNESFRYRIFISVVFAAAITGYIILSNGRAALVGLLVCLSAYVLLVVGVRKRFTIVLMTAVLIAAWGLRGSHLVRNASMDGDVGEALNAASSFRVELWRNVLRHPPENIWFGSGMGNVPDVVLTVQGAASPNLKHLHNFLLDCTYENGIVGVTALLLFLGYGLRCGLNRWREGTAEIRQVYGTLIASSLAIIAAALFSFSYTSRQFAIYLFTFTSIAAARRLTRR